MIVINREGLKYCFIGDRDDVRVLKDSLEFLHPERHEMSSYVSGKWDGVLKFHREGYFGHGLLPIVLATLKEKDIEYELVRHYKNLPKFKFSKPFLPTERAYQRKAIKAFLKFGWGIIKIPTRGGKTFVASEIMRILIENTPNFKVLFITESSDIYKQNPSEIVNFLGLKEYGEIRASKIQLDKQVTFAMMQTLQSKLKISTDKKKRKLRTELSKFLKNVGLVVIDEIHEFCSSSRIKVIKRLKPDYFLTLSATPVKKSQYFKWLDLQSHIGEIVYEIPEQTLVENGVLSDNKVAFFKIENPASKYKYPAYRPHLKRLIYHNKIRNNAILSVVKACKQLQLKFLVMCWSKTHANILSKLLCVDALTGDEKTSVREDMKKEFLSNPNGGMVVTEIWKKGITLPNVEVFINASGGKEETGILQKRGRVLGATKSKSKSIVFDFIDFDEHYFSKHSLARLEAYENQVGKDKIDCLNISLQIDAELVKYLQNWFNEKSNTS